MPRVRKSSIDTKLERAGCAKKSPKPAKPASSANRRGMARYGKHTEFESLVAAVEQDISRLVTDLQRARRKRRSLLAAQRQRLRYERIKEFRDREKRRMRIAYADKFNAPDDFV
jgi:hypothetical protein